MQVATERGLGAEAVAALSARRNEPEWLRQRRQAAWALFEAAPMPDASDEEWRRVDLSALNLDAYAAYAPAGGGLDAMPASLRPTVAAGGLVVQHNSDGVHASLPEVAFAQGVLFTSLDEAVRRHPELVEQYLGRTVPAAMGKFEALQAALWSGGTFLYVPRNVEVTVPLFSSVWADAAGAAMFPRTVVVAEQGSSVTFYEEHQSAAVEAFASPVAEVLVGDGAHVTYVTVQRWGAGTREFGTRRVVVGRDARLDWVSATLGAGQSKMRLHGVFAGEGSESKIGGIYFPDGEQHVHMATLQDHRAPHTNSDLFFKGALRDAAHAEYYGIIRVHPEAQQTNGYQQNRNLLLSDKAKADSIPILEIEANDVKCSHGATVGQIDPDQVFYLQCRGLPRPAAERMLVQAFFREVLDRIPDEGVRERVGAMIAAKVE